MNKKNLKTLKEVQVILRKEGIDYFENIHKLNQQLLANLKSKLPELEELLENIKGHWYYEDMIYRFYHNSFKVYHVQVDTCKIVELLKSIAPKGVTFNEKFKLIFDEGTSKTFQSSHNRAWEKHTRPLLEAFLHAKFFLEMAVKYGKELEEAPTCLPSGWAALLYFYNLR